MVSAEAAPFAKTGGLADAVSALSKALAQAGHDVKIIIPRYYGINRDYLNLCKKNILVSVGWSEILVDFYNIRDFVVPRALNIDFHMDITNLEYILLNYEKEGKGRLEYYFVDYEKLYGREGIYGDAGCYDYPDNPLRFSVLSRAAFALCKALNWSPDIIHSHDWAAGLTPVILKNFEKYNFPNSKSVFTIHNMGYQGRFPGKAYRLFGFPEEDRQKTHLDWYGEINFMQAAIMASDYVTTVSEKYAKEIQTVEGGFGLDGLMRIFGEDLKGILNGADLTQWNPETDSLIPCNYSITDFTGKSICKNSLQQQFFLEQNSSVPIIGIICRFADQKGINELFAPNYGCMYRMCKELPVQFVIVGSGESWCEKEVQKLSELLPNLSCYIGYNEHIAHLVEAGCDYFLMPSRYEPCGLNQIYSMLYGTLPIVRATGGLDDTVENLDEARGTGTGFKFYDLSPESIFNTVKWAISKFSDKNLIKTMQIAGMTKDFSWQKSAEEYIKLYKS